MAWYTISYVCGHSGREQLYGPARNRERAIEWAERNKSCPDCYRAELDRRRAAVLTAAQKANADLPTLAGSEKQVQWAEAIRSAARGPLALAVATCVAPDLTRDEMAAFAARILRQTEAHYWIEHRDDLATAQDVASYLLRRIRQEKAKAVGAAMISAVKQ